MHQDFKELLSAFNAGRVRYLIVGGYAVSFHAEPRATKDLDILIGTDIENGKAIYAALAKFGGPVEGLSAKDFTEPDNFFRMGTPPVMVDTRQAERRTWPTLMLCVTASKANRSNGSSQHRP